MSAHTTRGGPAGPNGGQAWPAYGQRTVRWSGQDEDGDPLRYRLQYSADDGATWRTIAVDLTGSSYALDLGRLAGSEMARLQVIVSDGVNTAMDASDEAFSVESKPPEVSILYPVHLDTLLPGRPVILQAAGTDLEEGFLDDDTRFVWRSSLEGDLGSGARCTLTSCARAGTR